MSCRTASPRILAPRAMCWQRHEGMEKARHHLHSVHVLQPDMHTFLVTAKSCFSSKALRPHHFNDMKSRRTTHCKAVPGIDEWFGTQSFHRAVFLALSIGLSTKRKRASASCMLKVQRYKSLASFFFGMPHYIPCPAVKVDAAVRHNAGELVLTCRKPSRCSPSYVPLGQRMPFDTSLFWSSAETSRFCQVTPTSSAEVEPDHVVKPCQDSSQHRRA